MVSQSAILKFGLLSSVDSATISGTPIALGNPLAFPARIVKIVNNSTMDVTISDGTQNIDFVPKGSFSLYDFGTNRGNASPSADLIEGTQLFASGTAGTGLIYLSYVYAVNPPIATSL